VLNLKTAKALGLEVPPTLLARADEVNRMKRREFITLLGGAAVWPSAARAQQTAVPVIGFLNGGSSELFAPYVDAFLLGLKEAGFVKDRNCAMAYRWARGRYEELPSLAAELVNLKVAVIAASGRAAVMAAKAATSVIPIIFLIGGDPVRLGLVSGFHKPGGNASGVTILNLALDLKRLGLLREALARTASIAVLFNPNFPRAAGRMREVQEAARKTVQDLSITPASNEEEIDQAFAKFDRRRPDALLVVGDPFFNARRDQIVALAARYAIPAIYDRRDFVAAGGLMSYGTNLAELYHQQGAYTGLVLKGADPAELPVLQLTKSELVINLKTAEALGVKISDNVLSLANEVIE
jgi:putative tryptophan/tyrosine transport system substrate-binding protein